MSAFAFLRQTHLRVLALVAVILLCSFVFTGFITSAYRDDRAKIGQAHFEVAQSEIGKGQVSDGIDEYRKALIFSPDKTEYRLALAKALVDAGRLDEAETHLQQLLQEDPTNGFLNLMLGRLALLRHRGGDAVDYYQRAVYEYWPPERIPERRKARWELVGLLSAMGKSTQAVAELMQLYSNAPPDPQQRAHIGFLLLKYGATSEAANVFQNLVRSSPQFEAGHRGLGEVDFRMANYASARHELQRAVRLNASDGQAATELAVTNQVIDLNPLAPRLTSQEQGRRSENLLSRVIKDLGQCVGDSAQGSLQDRLSEAQKLCEGKKPANADESLRLQDAAQQLWKDKALFCNRTPASDEVVDLVIAGIGHE